MTSTSRTAGARVVVAALVALLLGACGGTSTSTTPVVPSSSGPGAAANSAAPVGTAVAVTEKEFSITLDKTSFAPGDYTFAIQNKGSFKHNLTIEGPGVDSKTSPTLVGGESGSLTVTLQKGTYELKCSIPGHKDKGMELKITVA
jgi:uncharacterized cupredoxin-like copper-binding protein